MKIVRNKIGVQGGDYYQPVKEKPNSEQFRPPHPSDAVDDKDVQDFLRNNENSKK